MSSKNMPSYDVGQSIAHAVPLPMPQGGNGNPGDYQEDTMDIDQQLGSFQDFKAKLLDLITTGNALGVHRLLKLAPENDFSKFRFKMQNKAQEEIFVSPIALAVNVGDYSMVDSLINHLKNINIDEGIEAKSSD